MALERSWPGSSAGELNDGMIVCIGWGSLLWNPGELPLAGSWRRDGPELAIEFSRQARDDRISRERIERELGWVALKQR